MDLAEERASPSIAWLEAALVPLCSQIFFFFFISFYFLFCFLFLLFYFFTNLKFKRAFSMENERLYGVLAFS